MELDRNIRNLVSPLILLLSLIVAAASTEEYIGLWTWVRSDLVSKGGGNLLAVVLAGGMGLYTVGYLLSHVTLLLLSLGFYAYDRTTERSCRKRRSFSPGVRLGPTGRCALRNQVKSHYSRSDEFSTFHLSIPVHHGKHFVEFGGKMFKWMSRRWNAFMVAANCILALLVPGGLLLLGECLLPKAFKTALGLSLSQIEFWGNWRWSGFVAVLVTVLVIEAGRALRDISRVTELLLSVKKGAA